MKEFQFFSASQWIAWIGAMATGAVGLTAFAFQTFETKSSHAGDKQELRDTIVEMRKEIREDMKELKLLLKEQRQ